MSGSTAWQFDSVGLLVYRDAREEVQEAAIDLGATDLEVDDDALTIYTPPTELFGIADALETRFGLQPEVARLTKVPQVVTTPEGGDAAKVQRIIEALEDLDDVQNVYCTADVGAAVETG
jgi:transcriptional/translational regulatory protein YebC/TACO1